jgi:hypothetical protein
MPPAGFEPTISAGERPYTYDLDRAATGTGISNKLVRLIKMTLQNTEASVKIENLTSKPFSVSFGVR